MSEKFTFTHELPEGRERELLIILMEECAEVAARCSKALRFGLSEVQPGQPLTNAQRIGLELGDLYEVAETLTKEATIPENAIAYGREIKRKKMQVFMKHCRANGDATERRSQ